MEAKVTSLADIEAERGRLSDLPTPELQEYAWNLITYDGWSVAEACKAARVWWESLPAGVQLETVMHGSDRTSTGRDS